MARIFRRLGQLLDVDTTGVADDDTLVYDAGTQTWIPGAGGGGGGVTDHGALTGLADDDHTQYTTTAPASSARNVIQPTAGTVIAEVIKAHAAQTADVHQWQTSAGVPRLSLNKAIVFEVPSVTDEYYKIFQSELIGAEAFPRFTLAIEPNRFGAVGFVASAGDGSFDPHTSPLTQVLFQTYQQPGNRGNGFMYGPPYYVDARNNAGSYSDSAQIAFGVNDPDVLLYRWQVRASGHVVWLDDTFLHRTAAGKLGIGSALGSLNEITVIGGTDVTVADGGTGASTASAARTNLGLVIGTDVQAHDAELAQIAALADPNADRILFWDDSAGAYTFLTPGTNLTITGTTIDAAAGSSFPAHARARYGGVTQFSQPGIASRGVNTWTSSANRAQYFPFFVEASMVIDQIIVELTTGVAASTIRLCLYNADTDWQPTSLVTNTDTGALNATAAQVGVIATTITDTTLAAGRYLAWLGASTGNHVFRCIRCADSPYLGYPVALTGNSGFQQIYVAQTYAAPPSTGLAWTTVGTTPNGFDHPVFVRIKTP